MPPPADALPPVDLAGPPAADAAAPFGAFVGDEDTGALVRAEFSARGWPETAVHTGGIGAAVAALQETRSPGFLIVDLSHSADPRGDIDALADVCEPGTAVLVLGTHNDVLLFRDLLAAGVQDYLLKPFDADRLRTAIDHATGAAAVPARTAPAGGGGTASVAVIGVRGGVGASTVAAGLAWVMAEEHARLTALVDMDLQMGTAALAFDLEPGPGFCDLLEDPAAMDMMAFDPVEWAVSEHLCVLSAEAPLAFPAEPHPDAVERLYRALDDTLQARIVDLPRAMAASCLAALDVSDIVLVTETTLAGARDTIRMLALLEERAPDARVHLAVNKVAPAAAQEVALEDFAASVGYRVAISIPLDVKAAVTAARKGLVLARGAPGSKAVCALRGLAAIVLGEDTAADRSGSLLTRLLRAAS